jgi:hypothetical protein
MSAHSKIKIATAVLLIALSTGAASAATNRTVAPDSIFGKIQQIVRQIGRILRPLDEPTFPKP